ncbi:MULTISPECIES: cell division protein FtsB [Corallincola]|uniref:Cell division protein FtsB n=3 Tax=Corallincola TaxID=1775176 RepID=A0A368NP35_9GAMM|nr:MULTISPECIES: cell division protein FtsB [Corallincola]RCU51870.1 cell division protein FtsB [Corallincola holothuriorum]TAA47360.1 cell division protein FtsB [Corallincola spongiicola]TCI05021.1 cell division protein FtsB [Corallincola luteus]
MRLLWIILLIIFALLQQRLWFGKNSIRDAVSVHDRVAVQAEANNRLQQRNELMYAEINDLRNGNEAIEERARNELGMIKQGETFYRIIESPKQVNNE